VYHDREAELQARVDRRRVHIAHAGAHEPHEAVAALRELRASLARLAPAGGEIAPELELVCDPAPVGDE
jgi:hypothetical protein